MAQLRTEGKSPAIPVDKELSIQHSSPQDRPKGLLHHLYSAVAVLLLFLNFFLAQYDKFILSYFQTEVVASLNLTSVYYGVLSGYATSIVFALLAIPVAFIADYTDARIWVLSVAALWWSLCVLFQGLSHNFWQFLLARIGMGIGQAPVEALSISLISDIVGLEWLFICESLFYVAVYVGEAVSGQIATAFNKTGTPWNDALKAMGIVGMVIAVVTRVVLREPERRKSLIPTSHLLDEQGRQERQSQTRIAHARSEFMASVSQVIRMRSFWLLTLSSGARQFSGNVFGWYMPSYLSSIYTDKPNLLSHYGIIVGVVGSVAVVVGGVLSSVGKDAFGRARIGLSLTAIGGMISAAFVILMVLSLRLADGNQNHGAAILYGSMSAAYLTAELWLGAFASVLALILPPRTKTFCLAIYTSTIILIYSSAPQMIGLSLRSYEVGSDAYILQTRKILAILIPIGYWVAGIGFLLAIGKIKVDLNSDYSVTGRISTRRKLAFASGAVVLVALTISLFVVSLTVTGEE